LLRIHSCCPPPATPAIISCPAAQPTGGAVTCASITVGRAAASAARTASPTSGTRSTRTASAPNPRATDTRSTPGSAMSSPARGSGWAAGGAAAAPARGAARRGRPALLGQNPPQDQVAAVVHDDGHDREAFPDRRPERLRRVKEGAVSHHGHHRLTVPPQRG